MSLPADNLRGGLYMSMSMAGFGCNDALVKLTAANLSLFQVIFIRGVFVTALIAAILWLNKTFTPPTSHTDRKVIVLRVLGEIGSTFCFLTALFNMPIANVTSVLQATPIAVTLCAAFLLREKVGWRRYSAITIGFIGVLILVQPGTAGFTHYSLWALAAVAFSVLRDLSTRQLSTKVSSEFVAFCTAASITAIAGLLVMTTPWQPVNTTDFILLACAAAFLLAGYLFGVMAMRIGEIGFVSPFRYSVMLWAILLGYLFFGDVPDWYTLLGTVIIAGTGIYTLYRERTSLRTLPPI